MKIRTPGKLILSGEHSVVYGKPALAMAIDRFVEASIEPHDGFLFECDALNYHSKTTRVDLVTLKKNTEERYQEFQKEIRPIEEVLNQGTDLIKIASIDTLQYFHQPCDGLKIKLSSSIPQGQGLGSSAAVIVNILFGLTHYFKHTLDHQTFFQHAIALESLQHGKSSGLDIATCFYGGCIIFQNKQAQPYPAPTLSLFIINTGKPTSSTGTCVQHVSAFKDDHALWNAFEVVTLTLKDAIAQQDDITIKKAVHENHQLLCRIGVVPERVQQFIAALHRVGIAAKISGAGAIKGEHGGTILAITENISALQKIADDYGYSCQKIRSAQQGAQTL